MAKVARASKMDKPANLVKVVEDLRALKNRVFTSEMKRLEEDALHAMDKAILAANTSGGKMDEEEAKKIADADAQQNKEMITARFRKLDTGLQSLHQYIQGLVDLDEERERNLNISKTLDVELKELADKKKDFKAYQQDIEKREVEVTKRQEELDKQEKDVNKKLESVDLKKRLEDLDEREETLQIGMKAYTEELEKLAKMRGELNQDFDNLGKLKAETDADREKLEAAIKQVGNIAIKRLSANFEALLRKMLEPPTE